MATTVNIVVLWLYDPIADKLLTGGMERWCRDIARLARDHGYRVKIWQKSPAPFEKQLEDDIVIHGLKASLHFRGNRTLARSLQCQSSTDEPYIFVSQEICAFGKFPRSVAVNHGIWWDGDMPRWKLALNKRIQRKLILKARATICVDTNYINWCHAELRGRPNWERRLAYVPNYADPEHFKPLRSDARVDPLAPTILFPRRVHGTSLSRQQRGAGLLIDAIELLEAEGIRPRVVFAGRGDLQADIRAWADRRRMGDRVEVVEVSLDDMPALYSRADVVVVPTLEHEGTSLSAVEGLLSGKPVVVSHIGGLGNLVIDGMNGHVCDLTPRSLADAIRSAVNGSPMNRYPSLVDACVRGLGKDRWDRRVWSILSEHLGV